MFNRDLPHCDVENIASHGAGDSHIAEALARHDDRSDQIRDRCASCEQGKSHEPMELVGDRHAKEEGKRKSKS
jgi:hypothetical protein